MYINQFIKNTERIFPMQERYGYHRYDMNENPEGLPSDFVNSVLKEITPEFLSIYPEPDRFLNKYAKYIGVTPENVVATNGSDMAIRYLLETFGEVGKEVLTVSPSFEMYAVNCRILGYKHVPVAYEKNLSLDINKILAHITTDTRIVVLLNPNNPVGNTYTTEEVKKIIQRAREVDALVIVDEAYHYFYPETMIPLIEKYDNLAILRTFSKLFSLAACRLGIIISSPQVIHYTKNAKLTFDTNAIALLFAERLLDHPEVEKKLIDTAEKGKQHIIASLKEHGYESRNSAGNFIFIEPRTSPKELAQKLMDKKKILVKTYSNPLLAKYLRISTGSPESMDIFLNAFYELDRN